MCILQAVVLLLDLTDNQFAHPMTARMIRLVSQRQALRTSYTALTAHWLPDHIFPPPNPPVDGKLNIGYLSSDFKYVTKYDFYVLLKGLQ